MAGHVHEQFMARAIELSIENVQSGRGGPFGAVIVREGRIVAEGVNGVTLRNDPTAHAEVSAIRDACQKLGVFDLAGCEIYSSCEPCPMCLGAIYWARLDRIYYAGTAEDASRAGFDDAFIYGEFRRAAGERKIPMHSMMRTEAQAAFRAWEERDGKTPY